MPQPDPKPPAAQRERGDAPSHAAEDDRDAHEPGWTDGRTDTEPDREATSRPADVAKRH